MDNVTFARNLVKGKIAETIFAQMFRETKKYTVLDFGYERIIPELVQEGYSEDSPTLKILKTAPDFAVIDKNAHTVMLIEVKYMRRLDQKYVTADIKRMQECWNPSCLFIATQEGFFFGDINTIHKNNYVILPLEEKFIPKDVQEKYLKILKDFEANN